MAELNLTGSSITFCQFLRSQMQVFFSSYVRRYSEQQYCSLFTLYEPLMTVCYRTYPSIITFQIKAYGKVISSTVAIPDL